MARLPQPGADDDKWGSVLNEYLSVSHTATGTLKTAAVQPVAAATVADGGILNVKDYGTLGTANDSATFQAALNAAAQNGSGVVAPPGVYNIENLTIPAGVILGLDTAGMARFFLDIGTGKRKATLSLRRTGAFAPDNTSTAPMITVVGGGSGLRNVQLEGKGAPGTILVMTGFETTLENIRCISGTGIAIDVQRGNNTRWRNIYVDNCGGKATNLPAMKIWSKKGVSGANETNTLDIEGLTIERPANVALELAVGADTAQSWAEWIRIYRLHIESSYLDSPNVDPLIRIGNVRVLTLVDPFIYGGSASTNGVLIRHEERATRSYGRGGIRIIGGTLLGPDPTGKAQMATAIDLVSGDDLALIGTRLLRYSARGIKIASTYGSKLWIDPTCFESSKVSGLALITDLRTGMSTQPFNGTIEAWGHLTAKTTSKPTLTNAKGIIGGTLTVNATDVAGTVFWGTTTAAAGIIGIVNFTKPYTTVPSVSLTAGNAATAGLGLYVSAATTGFKIYGLKAPATNQADGYIQVHYHVIG